MRKNPSSVQPVRLRLLLVSGSYPPMQCGVGSYTARLLAALAARDDMDITFLGDVRAADAKLPPGVNGCFGISRWSLRELPVARRLIASADVVHIQFPTQGYGDGLLPMALPLLSTLLRTPCVQTLHEPRLGPWDIMLGLGRAACITPRPDIRRKMDFVRRQMSRGADIHVIGNASLLPAVQLGVEERKQVRAQHVPEGSLLLLFFGFLSPAKGCEALLGIAAARPDVHVVIAGAIDPDSPYHRGLLERIRADGLQDRIHMPGYLDDATLSRLIAAADAVVLPFTTGSGEWNTSLQAARAQGSFVVTTSRDRSGYIEEENTFFASPGAVQAMLAGIGTHAGTRLPARDINADWERIANRHVEIYRSVVSG